MLDFTLVKNRTITFSDMARDLTATDLRNLTNEMIDTMLSIIADARSVQTIDQVRHRFEESRRMRLAMLDAWPDEPHLEVVYSVSPRFGPFNATARFLMGLYHDDDHLGQLREIMRQVRETRSSSIA